MDFKREKVRFLGCVTSFSPASASLALGHLYPKGSNVVVSVNLELVIETLQPGLTRIGEWVNVIGYVLAKPRSSAPGSGDRDGSSAHVQALVIWPTGPLDIQHYEKSFEAGP
ncbi:telomere capping, CST complex subunit domain-containing protein [Hirsutella rhossiliensis]|uniref:Telomere capping, CST complex subunit domain-containing protein n=1 Tax=Hirsutella rhossiliensis TaxID=111463 RepID=A0A9P8SI30_9HYPO|nr:telomere capping, CST complex subunit domain-containing protein [Hirsutella rhossiliensis]KAH0963768.1 telomere capping, CST complex subunit domain-containing protein [Hirsutella rhossiliensis]